jgi:hypothetical protein
MFDGFCQNHNPMYIYFMHKRSCLLFFILLITSRLLAQNGAVILTIHSSHTSFPDTGRLHGHTGDSVFYSTAGHYRDSTVLIIAPKSLDAKKQVDMIFWFHGWRNNVANTAAYYQLTRQFIAANLNAVLVLPEAAKDAADSYAGKLEKPGVFKALVNDVLDSLKAGKLITANCIPGHILIGGHSGGGRVIGKIVANGQMEISEVMLFDAMYSETETFLNWLKANPTHRFIDMYTDFGYGPDAQSRRLDTLLEQQQIPFLMTEEKSLTPQQLQTNRLVIIHSLNQHNNIIFNPDNFKLFIENSPFLTKLN